MANVVYREQACRSALNQVRGRFPFHWSLNPYTSCAHRCSFCYARAYARRADRPSGERYGRVVGVKTNVAEILASELRRSSWRGESIAIGTATDPYQPAEGRYRLTRACLERLVASSNPFSITTRGPLIVRDLDLLVEASRRAEVTVAFSVPTLDKAVWRATEPGTAPPRSRLEVLSRLTSSGVRAGVFLAPVLPGLSDHPDGLEEVVRAAGEAGASFVWVELLNLRQGSREHFMTELARYFPELLPLYERLYARRAYLPVSVAAPVRSQVDRLRRRYRIADRRNTRLIPHRGPRQLSLTI